MLTTKLKNGSNNNLTAALSALRALTMKKNEINIKGLLITFSLTTLALLGIILYLCDYATQQEVLFDKYVNATDSLIHTICVQDDTFSDNIAEKDVWYDYTQVRKEIR